MNLLRGVIKGSLIHSPPPWRAGAPWAFQGLTDGIYLLEIPVSQKRHSLLAGFTAFRAAVPGICVRH